MKKGLKFPKRKGLKNGGTSDGDPPDFSKLKKGDPVPEGYQTWGGINTPWAGTGADGQDYYKLPASATPAAPTGTTTTPPATTGGTTTPTTTAPGPSMNSPILPRTDQIQAQQAQGPTNTTPEMLPAQKAAFVKSQAAQKADEAAGIKTINGARYAPNGQNAKGETIYKMLPSVNSAMTYADRNAAVQKLIESNGITPDGKNTPKISTELAQHITDLGQESLQYQDKLNAAAAAKYGKAYTGTLQPNQYLTPQEVESTLGKADAQHFYDNNKTYESYRNAVGPSYQTQKTAVGATDAGQWYYGYRMQQMYHNTPQQSASNTMRTPVDLRTSNNPATPAGNVPLTIPAPSGPSVKMIDGENKTIPPMQYDKSKAIINANTSDIGGMKSGGMFKGVKRGKKKMSDGGTFDPSTLTPDQLKAYQSLTPDQLAKLNGPTPDLSVLNTPNPNVAANTSMPSAGAMNAFSALAPVVANAGANAINDIKVNPENVAQNEGQSAASLGLKRMGQIAPLALQTAGETGGLSLLAIPAMGLEGGIQGAIQGKDKAKKAQQDLYANAVANAQKQANGGYTMKKNKTGMDGSIGEANMNAGGKIVGKGTAKSDSIPADIEKGSFIVPAENEKVAQMLRETYLNKEDGKAKLNQGGSNTSDVWLSNGEHMFTPSEVGVLKANGIDVDALAPNAKDTGYGHQDGGTVSSAKAKTILTDGTIRGHKISDKQKKYFGWIAGGAKADGGNVDDGAPGYGKGGFTGASDNDLAAKRAEDTKALQALHSKYPNDPVHGVKYSDADQAEINRLSRELSDIDSEVQARDTEKKFGTTYANDGTASNNTPSIASAGQNITTKPSVSAQSRSNLSPVDNAQMEQPSRTSQPAIDKAMSDFLATHTIGSQDAPVPSDGKTATSVVTNPPAPADASDPFGTIKKDGDTPSGNPLATSSTPKTFIPSSDAPAVDPTTGQPYPSAPPKTAVQNVYDSLGGLGGLLAVGQFGAGMAMSINNQKHKPTYAVDPTLLQRQQQAIQSEKFGFTPQEYSQATQQIANNNANVFNQINDVSGGDVGLNVANSRLAALDTNNAFMSLAAQNEQVRQAKVNRTDDLTAAVANQRRMVYEDSANMYAKNQQSAMDLAGAGLANLFGAIQSANNQKSIDNRAAKYGNVFDFSSMANPSTQTAA